jgi:phosphatidylglycerophosphate synthase
MTSPTNRRVLKTRTRAWPSAIARTLARSGVTPNQVSVAGIAMAGAAAYGFVASRNGSVGALLVAAAGIQLRLLCNLLDGLLAIEGGLKSPTGDLYNEVPDRVEDVLILGAAGLAVSDQRWGVWLGPLAALLAVGTAYARVLGGSLGFAQDFSGPMAKQHRMFALTVGTLAAAVEHAMRGTTHALWAALLVIIVGSAFTLVRRLSRIARQLRARAG